MNRPPDSPAPRRCVALLLAAALLLMLASQWQRDRPLPLPGLPAAASLPCVSYAPFRRPGHTPFDARLVVEPAQIEEDLRRLATLTGCVRTYGLDHGLDAVPAVARKLGLRVVLGAWIGRDPRANREQLERAIELAAQYRDVVVLLIVGNEVLLRGELPAAELARLLRQARREAPVPVSYADVWEFWLRHRDELLDDVDVVSAHVLPYWEDEPVAVDDAVAHVQAVAARLRDAFAGKPLFIAETGWPAAGRQRGPALPGPQQQAFFVRELIASDAARPLGTAQPRYNLIEAFDQPWKRTLEGAMGGAWGLFDAQGQQRVPLHGPPAPQRHALIVATTAAVAATAGLLLWRRRCGAAQAVAAASGAALLGGSLVSVAPAIAQWSRDPREWLAWLAMAAVSAACAGAALRRLMDSWSAPPVSRPGVLEAWRSRGPHRDRLLATAHIALLFAAATDVLALVFDGRYRPLLTGLWLAPALLLLALALLGVRLRRGALEERLLAAVCAGGAPALVLLEGLRNTQALALAAVLALLAAATLLPHRDRSAGDARAPREPPAGRQASAANSAAGADQRAL